MRRTIRSAACSVAFVGLSSLLGACDSVAPTAVAPEAAPAASLSARIGQVQQERLRKAGRPGLKRGVNYAPSARLPAVDESKTPPGLMRGQSASASRVRNLRLGEAALPSAEQRAMLRTKGGKPIERTGILRGGEPGEVGVANHEAWTYEGYLGAQAFGWSYPIHVSMNAWTVASKNITYLDFIADVYLTTSYGHPGYYQYTVHDYAENSTGVGASWSQGVWGGSEYYQPTLYLASTHYVYDEDGYGTYSGGFSFWVTATYFGEYMWNAVDPWDPCYPYGCWDPCYGYGCS